MSSPYPKLLWPIVVPAGGWNYVFNVGTGERTATVPAGTYASILELCDALQDAINDELPASICVITVSEVGEVDIYIPHIVA